MFLIACTGYTFKDDIGVGIEYQNTRIKSMRITYIDLYIIY